MSSTFRIPKATIDGAYGAVLRRVAHRMWGQVPDNAYVLWHNKPVMNAVLGFERKVAKWDALDPHLKTFARMASAGVIGCSWCMDFGYFMAHEEGLDTDQGARGAALARVGGLHRARARRHGVRRGDDRDPARR